MEISRLTTLCLWLLLRLSPRSLHLALQLSAAHLGVSPHSSACVCTVRCWPGPGTVLAYSSGTWSASVCRTGSSQCRSEKCWKSRQGDKYGESGIIVKLGCYSGKSQMLQKVLRKIEEHTESWRGKLILNECCWQFQEMCVCLCTCKV